MEEGIGSRVCRMKHWITCIAVVCVSLFGTTNQILAREKQQDVIRVQMVQADQNDIDSYQITIEQELGQDMSTSQEYYKADVSVVGSDEIRSGVMLFALAVTGSACIGLGIVLVCRNRKYWSH